MEQLQVVLAHLKVHRFWYSLGLAVLFAYLVSGGAADVMDKARTGEKQLEDSFTAVKGYQSGDKANAQWKQAVGDKKKVLDEDFLSSHEKLYLEQEKLMTWPKEVAEVFKGRPFGAKLDDNSYTYIFQYRRACDDLTQVAQVFWELNVLDKQDDGKIFGIIDVGRSPSAVMTQVIQFPTWSRDPSSMEAWYAQELIWIQRAIVKSIARINRSTAEAYTGEKGWLYAPIKRVHAINIGPGALDQVTLAAKKELVEYQTDAAAPPPTAGASSQSDTQLRDVIPRRYIEKTATYRLVPVSVHLLIDQAKITDVLTGLANTDFKFTIAETRLNYSTERTELPALLREAGVSLPGRGAENPLYNCVDLDVYGTMRFYEMPAALKEKREKGAKEAAPAEAKPTEAPSKDTPTPPKADAKAAAKTEAKAAGDAAKAAAPPPADASKSEAPPKETPKAKAQEETIEPTKKAPKEEASKKSTEEGGAKVKPKDPTARGGKSDGKKD